MKPTTTNACPQCGAASEPARIVPAMSCPACGNVWRRRPRPHPRSPLALLRADLAKARPEDRPR